MASILSPDRFLDDGVKNWKPASLFYAIFTGHVAAAILADSDLPTIGIAIAIGIDIVIDFGIGIAIGHCLGIDIVIVIGH